MVLEFFSLKEGMNMLVSSIMIRDLGLGTISGRISGNFRDGGTIINSTVSGSIIPRIITNLSMAYGKRASE